MSKNITTKKSIGVVLFNKSLNKILMIQKKVTYAFIDFIFGNYCKNPTSLNTTLLKLFSNITLQEKSILLSLQFDYIWYSMFATTEPCKNYYVAMNHYNKFINDGGKLLKQLVLSTPYAQSPNWEPPKGRRKKNEPNIICAIREFEEETNIDSDNYNILPNYKINYIFIENNIQYNIVYYVATMKENKSTSLSLTELNKLKEINDIRWVPLCHLDSYTMFEFIKLKIIKISKLLKSNKLINK